MQRLTCRLFYFTIATFLIATALPTIAQESDVVSELNQIIADFRVTEGSKSYKTLFDAVLELSDAPSESGRADWQFNINTISPSMSNWDEVSNWAESNPGLRTAMLAVRDNKLLGLPYGSEVDSKYRDAGMYADVAVDGNLRIQDFAYLDVMELIGAYYAAETYRLLEAGQSQDAVDLTFAMVYILDQQMKRQYQIEVTYGMRLLIDVLAVLRDQMYIYFDKFSQDQFSANTYEGSDGKTRKGISFELPWLRIDLLQMPEGDYISAKALVNEVFSGPEADPEKFSETYARIQAQDAAFTQFGAARRWNLVARVHGSRKATEDQLRLVFEDWLRRWGIRSWHEILDITTQYDRTNPVRYAAVTYSMRNIDEIFGVRRQLKAAVSGTTMAAALNGYRKRFGKYPDDIEKVYAQFVRKREDVDAFDKEARGMGYRYIGVPTEINTQEYGFIKIEGGLLWARGADFTSNRGESHSADGLIGDIVFWPPMRALAREQGKE